MSRFGSSHWLLWLLDENPEQMGLTRHIGTALLVAAFEACAQQEKLTEACLKGDVMAASKAIGAGAEVTPKGEKGAPPLHWATWGGHVDVMQVPPI